MIDVVLLWAAIAGLGIIAMLIAFIATLAIVYSVKLAIDIARYGL